MVFLVFVVVLAVIGLTMVMGASSLQSQEIANRAAADQQAYLDDAARAIRVWYQENLARVDAVDGPPAIGAMLNRAGVARRYGVQAAASHRIVAGEVAYRVIVMWIPVTNPDRSVFNVSSGQFTPAPGVRHATVSGRDLQAKAVAETRRAMAALAGALENYFSARFAIGGRDVRVNQFRPDPSCAGTVGVMPCLDTYTMATRVDWTGVGLGGVSVADAWGTSLEVSNLQDAQTTDPPYSFAIRDRTPFGTVLRMNAVQRL